MGTTPFSRASWSVGYRELPEFKKAGWKVKLCDSLLSLILMPTQKLECLFDSVVLSFLFLQLSTTPQKTISKILKRRTGHCSAKAFARRREAGRAQ